MPTLELIGSTTSPYVRRFRLYLHGVPYRFDRTTDIFKEDDARLSAINPLKRVPVLLLDGQPVWESRVIFYHLQRALGGRPLDIAEENVVSAVDTLQDMLIQSFLLKRFDHPLDEKNPYFARHGERRALILAHLGKELAAGRLARWDYPAMSLYALLDWGLFRQQLAPAEVPGALERFRKERASEAGIAETDPRLP